MAITLEELIVEIDADAKGLEKGIKKGQKGVNSFSKSLKNLAGVLGAAFAVKKIADFGKASVDAARQQIEAETKLTTVLKERTNATDEQIQSIKDLASEQQKLGVIGDEVQLAGAQQLSTFVKTTDSVEQLLPALNNLVAQQKGYNATAGDATNIANLFGKVLDGQTGALSRVGVSFTEAQKEILQFGTESERAATLAQVINDNVGDVNKALAETDAGRIQQAKNAFGDLQEEIGKRMLPTLGKLATFTTQKLIPGLSKLGPSIASKVTPFIDKFKQSIEGFAKTGVFENFKLAFEGGITNIDFPKLIESFTLLKDGILSKITELIPLALEKFQEFVPKVIDFLVTNMPSIIQNFIDLRIQILETIIELLPQLIDTGILILESLIEGIVEALPVLIDQMISLIDDIATTIKDLLPQIIDSGIKIINALIDGILEILPALIDQAIELIDVIISTIVDLLPDIIDAGVEILFALIDGIIDALPELLKTIVELIPKIIKIITDNLPKILKAGISLTLAIIDGLIEALPELIDAVIDIIPLIVGALLEALPDIIGAGIEIILAMIDGLIEAVPKLITATFDIGKQLLQGLIDGIFELGPKLASAITGVVGKAVDKVKSFLGIKSPSKLFEDIGINTGEGFIKGVDKLNNAATASLESLVSPSRGLLTGTQPTTNNRTTNNNQAVNIANVNVREQEDVNSIARMLFQLQNSTDDARGLVPV